MDDAISRKAVLSMLTTWEKVSGYSEGEKNIIKAAIFEVENMPAEIRIAEDGTLWIDSDKMKSINRVIVTHDRWCRVFYQEGI